MKGDFRVCPACGTRNKPKWEFCARCGDSLQGVPLGDPAPLPDEPDAEQTVSSAAFPWLTGVGLLAFGALAVGMTMRSEKRSSADRPNPHIFTLPTLPPSLPSARAQVKDPGTAAFEEAHQLMLKGDAAGALPLLSQAVAYAPENAMYRNLYAKALLATGQTDEGLRQLDVALRLSPGDAGYLADAARALDRAGNAAEASRAYEALLAREPQNVQVLHDLASLRQRTGHFDQALPLLRQLVEARPEDVAFRQELAHTLEKTGNVKAAQQEYEKILAETPGADATRSLLERSGDMAEAVKEYREYARLAPNAPDARQLADRADQLERKIAAARPAPPS